MKSPVIILGMHRSGTSCLTGCLEAGGLYMGNVQRIPQANPKGNRENREIMHLNNAVLEDNSSTWDHPPDSPVCWSAARKIERDRLIDTYPKNQQWGFKDPRTLLVLNSWLEALPNASLVASFRHPVPVAQSLNARNGFPLERGLQLWLHYNRILLDLCRQRQVALIHYSDSAHEYEAQLMGILKFIGIPADLDAISFFEPEMCRNRNIHYPQIGAEVQDVYDSLIALVA